jgi:hypothetical protein
VIIGPGWNCHWNVLVAALFVSDVEWDSINRELGREKK